ncbi:hypothetical protein MUK42_10764 [Musa troglodytarum]|uniref:Uncharacterized protein n=1 Tax=Musa troglodytarum TaxID=320322 RepID=A0A9E7KEF0_9LILI|nr:hypothetical protein MUK42_10764 [Musa troglodytarum]
MDSWWVLLVHNIESQVVIDQFFISGVEPKAWRNVRDGVHTLAARHSSQLSFEGHRRLKRKMKKAPDIYLIRWISSRNVS